MATLEEKLLEKMAHCHPKYLMLDSIEKSAFALYSYTKLYNDGTTFFYDGELSRKIADEHIPKILANLELHIQLLQKAYYPNTQEIKEQLVQEIAKKYEIQ